jgi:glutamine amidotransferase-like protein/asparagine synthase
MSGIAGILNLDGSPVDGRLLARMTEYLRFRGPDGHGMHAIGNVGFGHTLLKLVEDTGADEQPFTLDGRRWIVADARVDARPDLVAALRARGHELNADAADAELILRAYDAWGDDCVTHLLGDFTFAIWDGPERRLFCARDQLGVKPFYYAQLGRTVVFSNMLDGVRLHPAVSRELNDRAVADFLLFGANQEAGTTTFRDVLRLPPAHSISWSAGVSRCHRYWTLPIDEPIAFTRAGEYAERFLELLGAAVSDRLRTRRVAVLMSGGLDSPTLAAVAAGLLRNRSADWAVHAMTSVYDRLIPDSERHYAGLVAKHLDIPIDRGLGTCRCSHARAGRQPAGLCGGRRVPREDVHARAGLSVRRRTGQRAAVRMAALFVTSDRAGPSRFAGSRDLERSADASACSALVADSAEGRRQPAGETMAPGISGLAQRGVRPAVRLPGPVGRSATSVAGAASCPPARPRRIRRGVLAAAVRRMRYSGGVDTNGDASSVSRCAAAPVHVGPAGHAVVSEQTHHSPGDEIGPASRRHQTKEVERSGKSGLRAGSSVWIATARAVADLVEVRECG